MHRRIWWVAAAGLLVLPFGVRLLIRALSPRPTNLGIASGRLTACPGTPNCVVTEAADEGYAIAPLTFNDTPADAFQRLQAAVEGQSGARLIAARADYLYFEFTTPLMGFIDDVEFRLDAGNRTIHFRSASRLGRSDLGTNRKRMEQIRRAFAGH